MNTLGYVARQFDVLASSSKTKTKTKKDPDPDRKPPPIPRVASWSTKSFLFPPTTPTIAHRSAPKRSHSSPAFHPHTQHQQPPLSSRSTIDVSSSSSSSSNTSPLATTTPSTSTSTTTTRSKPPQPHHHIESVIDRVFFIRVFLLVWDQLKSAWSSLLTLLEQGRGGNITVPVPVPLLQQIHEKSPLFVDDQSVSPQPPSISISVHENNVTTISVSVSATTTTGTPAHFPAAPASTSPTTPTAPALPQPPRKTPFHLPKTLVLDLDETLIHSTSRPMPFQNTGSWLGGSGSSLLGLGSFGSSKQGAGHMVEVVLGGRSTIYHVYKRPFVDFFLRTVSSWYTLVIFTASMQEYADPVIDWLDAGRGILEHRFFRDSCTQLPNGSYTKDLSVVEADLSRVCLVDNSPVSYSVNEANGIPIEGWTHDPSDEALLDLLPVLDSLRFTSDVRRVLGLRSAGVTHRPS